MRRICAILLSLLLLPGLAMAQRLAPESQTAAGSQPAQDESLQEAWLVPVLRSPDGHWMALLDRGQPTRAPLSLIQDQAEEPARDVLNLDGDRMSSVGVSMRAGSRLYSSLRLNSISSNATGANCNAGAGQGSDCQRGRQTWRGGSVAGGYQAGGLLIDLGMNWLQHDPGNDGLFLLVPDAERSSLMGIPSQWIESLNRVKASGSMALGDNGTRLNMGASVGRVRLLPGHSSMLRPNGLRLYSGFEPGLESIDQKAISLGLGKGAVSGTIVGRLMRPESASQLNPGATQQWSAIDLGITVRLPWEGELSLGAQNLWSSGDKANNPNPERDPVQSRIPYIQYHQEL